MILMPSGMMHEDITDQIIKAYYNVYDALPYGIPESAFHRAMHIALEARGLAYETQKVLSVYYCDKLVGQYRADLIVAGKVIIEIKTAPRIVEAHLNQLRGYLKLANLHVGLIMNFGPEPKFERYFLKPRTIPSDKSEKSVVSEGS